MHLKRIFISLILAFAFVSLHAQSQAELEAAKAMARSYGYSESEIESLISTQKAGLSKNGEKEEDEFKKGNTTKTDQNQDVIFELTPATEEEDKDSVMAVYGHSFFSSKGNGLISSFSVAVPDNYILSPGDEVIVNIWGGANATIHDAIGKDGSIMITNVGPVKLAGMTVITAETALRKSLARIYSGLSGGDTSLKLSIGRAKTMTVNVTGDVVVPGVYSLPAMASISSAVYQAGGVNETASVRNIKLYRGGKLAGVFDLYKFIFDGAYDDDLRLRDNDVIFVPSNDMIVAVDGAVKRPMLYEMTEGESLDKLVRYAGGFNDDADKSGVHVDRMAEGRSFEIPADRYQSFMLESGDTVRVRQRQVIYTNRVFVTGAVNAPGAYSIDEHISSVKDLVEQAGGLVEGAFLDHAIVHRVGDNLKPASVGFNLKDVLDGSIDVPLKREDSLFVFYTKDLVESSHITVFGEVVNEGKILYRQGMTLGEALIEAGGLLTGADLGFVEVASRGTSDNKATVVSYDIKNNPDNNDVLLKPRDMIFVRRMEHYRKLQTIEIKGEVAHPGTYVIEKSTVRLSDVIKRAGGFTDAAYVKGSSLTRTITDEERARFEIALNIAEQMTENSAKDSVDLDVALGETYSIGIDMEKAIDRPDSEFDVILRTGDIITVPQMNNTVKISGSVFYPNVVVFNPDYTLKDYISQAGGKLKNAKIRHTYAVYMSGLAAKKGRPEFKMEPGMEIIVPKETRTERKLTAAEIAAIASSSTSIAYMAASLVRVLM